MGKTNKEIVEDFFRNPWGSGKSGNIFFEEGVIYSYGYHFPMAVLLSSGSYLLNGDSYSSTTSNHQSIVRRLCPSDRIIVPFSALELAFGRNSHRLGRKLQEDLEIVDSKPDWFTTYRVKNKKTGEVEEREVHHLGASVFKLRFPQASSSVEAVDYFEYFLSGLDETGKEGGTYHLTQLPWAVDSVDDAFEIIKPDEVIGLYEGDFLRQGEWFFVPCEEIKKIPKEEIRKNCPLPNRGREPNMWRHIATYGVSLDGKLFVKGTVRHPDHKMLSLGETWHQAFEAWGAGEGRMVVSFAAGGNVD